MSSSWCQLLKIEPTQDGDYKTMWNETGVAEKAMDNEQVLKSLHASDRRATMWS